MKQKYFIGNIKKWQEEKRGYFLGQFINKRLFPQLNSEQVEIAWKKFDEDFSEKAHYHQKGSEVTIVLQGKWIIEINGKRYNFKKGDFLVVYPPQIVQDILISKGSEMIIIKFPSVANDKFF